MATSYVYNELTGEFEEREIIPPRIKYFRLRNRKAFLDKPCTIEWEVENASSVSLDRVGPQNATGFFTYRPNSDSRWVLRATGEGEVTQTLEVEAYPLPTISSFAVQQGQDRAFYVGDKTTIEWKADNFDSIELNGEDVSSWQSKTIELQAEDTDLSLVVICEEQKDNKHIHIHSYKRPKISFTTDKQRLRKGKNDRFTLEWDVEDAVSVSVFDSSENIISNDKTGSIIRYGDNGLDFTLEAIGLDGQRTFKKQISLEVHNDSVVTFKADKLYIMPGVPVHLSWDVKHADDVELVGVGSVPCTGKHLIEPTNNTTVILRVTDKFGTTEHKQTITMLPLPRVQLKMKSPAYHTTLSVVQPRTFVNQFRTFVDLSVSLSKSSLPSANCKRPDIEFAKFPQFVTSQFELKRESVLQGVKDVINHLSQSFINKLNQFNYHGK